MGVTYKLKPEIISFILEQKKTNPKISCRKLTPIIEKEFQLKVSKSSVNAIFKQAGLSMPSGRRKMPAIISESPVKPQTHPPPLETPSESNLSELPPEWESTGLILLKAVESLIGGRHNLAEPEVRCIEVNSADGNVVYIDGQFHTIWSGPSIPYDFSISICNLRSYINKYFKENSPIILLMAPGYDTPTKEFFSFLFSLASDKNYISSLSLLGNKLEKLESLIVPYSQKRKVIFGVWPWQFVKYRKIKAIGEFNPVYLPLFDKEFFAAEIEIELFQPALNQYVAIKGYALKLSLEEKIRVLILANFVEEISEPNEVISPYLENWPNFEEGFQDFSHKIELFTYTANSQRFFSTEMLNLDNIGYLEALDLYARWHFFPSELAKKPFSEINEQFYGLKVNLNKRQSTTYITFQIPPEYQFSRQLEYTLRRLAERNIILPDKTRLWFSL
ncbi:MAG: helix-turn-helix domain-containing protein [Candidatus Omnitrophica bacterium]|nr:helix-turn-helix domain-containing protein [Candidatus Omnitrophota bacterium]